MLPPERIRSAQRSSSSANHLTPTATSVTPNSSPNFLTPFLPGPRSMSPPPKKKQNKEDSHSGNASTDGYFNLRKSGRGPDRSDGYERMKRGNNTSSEEDMESDERTPGAERQCLKWSGRINTSADMGAVDVEPILQQQHQTWPRLATRKEEGADPESISPAVHSLRSLTKPVKSDIGPGQRLRRMSSAVVNGLHFLTRTGTAELAPPHPQRSRYSGERQKSVGCGTLRDGNRRRPRVTKAEKSRKKARKMRERQWGSEEAGGWATPASITLRKASEAWTLAGSSKSVENKGAELVAFHSERVEGEIKGVEGSEVVVDQDCEYNADQPATVRFMIGKRQSDSAASSTLTFADVHVAPGTFEAEGAKKRKISMVATATATPGVAKVDTPSRRISTVHFRSRDSVHEVIWREDETTSGSSLTSCGSWLGSMGLLGGRSPEDGGDDVAMALPLEDEVDHRLEPYQAGLMFQWSWGRHGGASAGGVAASSAPESVGADHERLSPVLKRLVSAENPEYGWLTRRSSDPSWCSASVKGKRASSAGVDRESGRPVPREVESFPPLRDRSSTMEWRRAPLVDINMPASNVGGGGGEVRDGEGDMGERRGAERDKEGNGVRAQGGKEKGRVGSCVGFSSHVRVRHHGQR